MRLAVVAIVALVFAGAVHAQNRVGYCQGGTYLDLEVGQNLTDPQYAHATPAFEIQDTQALTCTLPLMMAPTGEFDGVYPIVFFHHRDVPDGLPTAAPILYRLSAPRSVRVGQNVFFISRDVAPAKLCYRHGTSVKHCMWAQAGSWEIRIQPGHEQYFTLVARGKVRTRVIYRNVA